MTTTTIKKEQKTSGKLLEPCVAVLMGASGITEVQARICVLYVSCTHRYDLERRHDGDNGWVKGEKGAQSG